MDGEVEQAEELATTGTDRRRTHEHVVVGVGDQFHQSLVARSVQPTAARGRAVGEADAHVDPGGAGLDFGQSHRTDFGIGEGHSRDGVALGQAR